MVPGTDFPVPPDSTNNIIPLPLWHVKRLTPTSWNSQKLPNCCEVHHMLRQLASTITDNSFDSWHPTSVRVGHQTYYVVWSQKENWICCLGLKDVFHFIQEASVVPLGWIAKCLQNQISQFYLLLLDILCPGWLTMLSDVLSIVEALKESFPINVLVEK